MTMPKFDEFNKGVSSFDVIFIRDLISAMTECLYFNFDECVRKVITLIENYFSTINLNRNSNPIFLLDSLLGRRKSLAN